MQRRSYRALAEQLRTTQHLKAGNATVIRRIERWAMKYQWRERVRAYDQARAAAERARVEAAVAKMNAQLAEAAVTLGGEVEERLLTLLTLDGQKIAAAQEAQRLLALGKPVPLWIRQLMAQPPLPLVVKAPTLVRLWLMLILIERRARGDQMRFEEAWKRGVSARITITAAPTSAMRTHAEEVRH